MIDRLETIELHYRKEDGSWTWEGTSGDLVRCKDCRYCKYDFVDNANYCLLNRNREQSDEWFCADAERAEE